MIANGRFYDRPFFTIKWMISNVIFQNPLLSAKPFSGQPEVYSGSICRYPF
jgi:hypothetical protein